MHEGLKGWAPAPGLTGEVEFTAWVPANGFDECQVVGSPLRLRVHNAGSEAQWVVFWADSDVSSRRGTVKYGRNPARSSGYDDDTGRAQAKADAKAAAVEILGSLPDFDFAIADKEPSFTIGPFEFCKWWNKSTGCGCVSVDQNLAIRIISAYPKSGFDVTLIKNGETVWMGRSVTIADAIREGKAQMGKYLGDKVVDVPSFTKSDATKPRAELLPPRALLAVSRVLTIGAAKYGHENHLRAGDGVENRYMGATLRHLLAHMSGETADGESGESHLAHAAADLLLMLERSHGR